MKNLITLFLAMTVVGLAVSVSLGADNAEKGKTGPSISFQSLGWDGTKSFYQVAGTATAGGGDIEKVEYFINDKPDYPGTGTTIPGTSGLSPLVFTFSIPETVLNSGDNTICIDAMSSARVWGPPTCITATK
ncbi:MAG TPA: hypothetical protein VLD55_00585 [Candidatus Sulfobium mesophilum]|jgi:hypothetical protein|nr:hypothetical protein [Candidatus Sulfobium mesophilum]